MAEAILRRAFWAGLAALSLSAAPASPAETRSGEDSFGAWDVDLSGDGVVAISRTKDGKRTLMLYCRQDDGIARVRLGGLDGGLNETLEAIFDAGGIEVFGQPVEGSDAGAAELGGAVGIDLAVEGFHPDFVVGQDMLFIGNGDGIGKKPAAYPDIRVTGENAAAAFAVALRNCV